MKILVLTDAFLPDHTGGISKSLLPEVEAFVSLGNKVTVITRSSKPDQPKYEVRKNYELYRYFSPHKKSFFYKTYPIFSLLELPYLISSLHRQKQFDVAYVHNPFQANALRKVLPKLPCLYVYHASTYSEIKIDNLKGKYGIFKPIVSIVNKWIKSLEGKVLNNADQIIVRSQFMMEDMNNLYENINSEKIAVLPLCVDTERFCCVDNNIEARQRLGLPEDKYILLTVRRLVARMGIENLISAMPSVIEKFPNILLLIGGTGYLEENLWQMIQQYKLEKNVKLLGFLPEEKLPTYYQAANLFVLPTLAYEGFGLVTIESLACGTPVLATPVGASPELLKPLGKDLLFKDSTPKAISEGIILCLTEGLNQYTRTKCSNYCLDNYSKIQIGRLLESILTKLITY
ncbi:glycosyltransferase family 4 protein [Nostoc sphaeroides]|uniref:Glycosyltransferase family 1 protein n=1 Tax=Nostoc sphaeroides CCNUC1 TaxID=2653204 RepID=A0A5P8VSG2_9NOSO|nr:glycosyltransferase family 4 protein [Nostoc sphaeroides]QFS43254.1 glycosyltransferase family 1 protein [Nostoc sphaeroides CCNUC1]